MTDCSCEAQLAFRTPSTISGDLRFVAALGVSQTQTRARLRVQLTLVKGTPTMR